MASSGASSSSSPSSTPEYMRDLVYTSASTPFLPEKQGRPFRVITPALHQQKRKRDLLDAGAEQAHSYPAGEMSQFRVVVRPPLVPTSPASSFGPSGKLKAKPPKTYTSSEELLAALAKTCLEDPEVDFSGSYLVAENDADTLSDKQRVQTVTHEIWKATGYRFTVKDHPPSDHGHKTRLWCSQDEARRSKHRRPGDVPRLSKQGELFAKPRFPCRSRLMISCLPEGPRDARVVTVRMHHYFRHDAYLESEARPAAPPPQPQPRHTSQFFSAISAPLPPHLVGRMDVDGGMGMDLPPPPPPLHEQEGEWGVAPPQPEPDPSPTPSPHFASASSPHFASAPSPRFAPAPSPRFAPAPSPRFAPAPSPRFAPAPAPAPPSASAPPPIDELHHPHTQPYPQHSPPHPPPHAHPNSPHSSPHPHPAQPVRPPPSAHPHSPHPPPHPHPAPAQHVQHAHPHPPPDAPPALSPADADFQRRMRTHIARIRDFCDGLEFQVQFNDHRMLEALERDAAPFLALLDDCLRQEGR